MREQFSHAENDFSRGTSACPVSDKFSTPIIDNDYPPRADNKVYRNDD